MTERPYVIVSRKSQNRRLFCGNLLGRNLEGYLVLLNAREFFHIEKSNLYELAQFGTERMTKLVSVIVERLEIPINDVEIVVHCTGIAHQDITDLEGHRQLTVDRRIALQQKHQRT
jgi:hypothetical protein